METRLLKRWDFLLNNIIMCKELGCTVLQLPNSRPVHHGALGVAVRSKLWSNKGYDALVLPVYFKDAHNTNMVAFFMKAAARWEEVCNVQFPVTKQRNEAAIRVSFNPDAGHYSYMGTDALHIDKDVATLNLAFAQPGAALHEIGHALGFGHEHSNPNDPVPYDYTALYAYYEASQGWSRDMVDRQLQLLEAEKIIATRRDAKSIMHYPVPNSLTIGDYSIDWNTELSKVDIEFFGSLYPFSDKKVDDEVAAFLKSWINTPCDVPIRYKAVKALCDVLHIELEGKGVLSLRGKVYKAIMAL